MVSFITNNGNGAKNPPTQPNPTQPNQILKLRGRVALLLVGCFFVSRTLFSPLGLFPAMNKSAPSISKGKNVVDLYPRALGQRTVNISTRDEGPPDAASIVEEEAYKSKALADTCQLDLQKQQKERIKEWFIDDVPMLADVIQVDPMTYNVLFFLGGMTDKRGWMQSVAAWKCNDHDDGRILDWHHKTRTMVVQCSAANGTRPLESVTAIVNQVDDKTHAQKFDLVRYNATQYQICDKLTQASHVVSNLGSGQPDSGVNGSHSQLEHQQPRLATCTSIRGDNIRPVVDQWVEYHRLIGVEHFFIYVNEEWNDLKGLPQRPYISYVPFDYCICNHVDLLKKHNRTDLLHPVYWHQYPFFQDLVNTDCLHRSKQLGFDWITTHDVDEYIRVMPSAKTLPQVLNDNFPTNSTGKIGALLMKSRPYGKNHKDPHDNSTHHQLLVDYVWRQNTTLKKGRHKLVVNPRTVNYLDVHGTKGRKRTLDLDHNHLVHLHHYKNPEKGPNQGGDPRLWVKDESLAQYRKAILDRLLEKPSLNTSQVYSNN